MILIQGICQRDVSQYYKHIDNDKYDIQKDIKSLFTETIKKRFSPDNCKFYKMATRKTTNRFGSVLTIFVLLDIFDVIRYKKDKVKIVDFGPLTEEAIKSSLFTYEELHSELVRQKEGELRFISEDMGIQPKLTNHVCVPKEINEFFQGGMSVMDQIRKVCINSFRHAHEN